MAKRKKRKSKFYKDGWFWALTIIAGFVFFGFVKYNSQLISQMFVPQSTAGLSATQQNRQGQSSFSKVKIEITDKGFNSAKNQITFNLKFTNQTNKDIKSVGGVLAISDASYQKLAIIEINYNQVILAGQSKIMSVGHNYDKSVGEDVKLKYVELQDLRFDYEINSIIYTDNTSEVF